MFILIRKEWNKEMKLSYTKDFYCKALRQLGVVQAPKDGSGEQVKLQHLKIEQLIRLFNERCAELGILPELFHMPV